MITWLHISGPIEGQDIVVMGAGAQELLHGEQAGRKYREGSESDIGPRTGSSDHFLQQPRLFLSAPPNNTVIFWSHLGINPVIGQSPQVLIITIDSFTDTPRRALYLFPKHVLVHSYTSRLALPTPHSPP